MPVTPQLLSRLPRQVNSKVFERGVVADLPAGRKRVEVRAARNSWPDQAGDVIEVILEQSLDNGTTWQLVVSFRAAGGTLTRPDGTTETHSSANLLMDTQGTAKLRTRCVVLGTGIDTEVDTNATDE